MPYQSLAEQEDRTLLDEAAADRIRHYIARKHPELTAALRAEIWADAVHRAVERELPEFEAGTKAALRQELVRRMGTSGRFRLRDSQVVEACRQLELEEAAQRQLERWIAGRRGTASQTPGSGGWKQSAGPVTLLDPATNEPLPSKRRARRAAWAAAVLLLAILVGRAAGMAGGGTAAYVSPSAATAQLPAVEGPAGQPPAEPSTESVLPDGVAYRPVDPDKLREWLADRNSMLAEEPYLSAILDAAEEYQVHPLLLFAITGQEQGYVPKDHKQAGKIANNPFNVYHSWERYNTSIKDSARTAARTIVSISRTRPEEADPILWLNTRYAEDPKWGKGVLAIFEKMRKEIGEADTGPVTPPSM